MYPIASDIMLTCDVRKYPEPFFQPYSPGGVIMNLGEQITFP